MPKTTFIVPFGLDLTPQPFLKLAVGATFVLRSDYDTYIKTEGIPKSIPPLYLKMANGFLSVAGVGEPPTVQNSTLCYEIHSYERPS